MTNELKVLLGAGYEVAKYLGERLGEALNDVIDKALPPSEGPDKEKGGKYE